MIGPEPRAPGWKQADDLAPKPLPAVHLHGVALPVIEAYGLDARVEFERIA